MLNSLARSSVSKVTDPIGKGLLQAGLSPDLVTVIGTIGVVAGSVALLGPRLPVLGHAWWSRCSCWPTWSTGRWPGPVATARTSGWCSTRPATGSPTARCSARWRSTRSPPTSGVLGIAALICLVTGQVISYVKARADSVGLKIGGALAERAERNVLGLVGAGLAGLGVPHALDVCLWILAVAGLVTVVQRLVQVRRAAVKAAADTGRTAAPAVRHCDGPRCERS